ncbi:MAG: DNA polymerase III subunit alpha, partial [Candidatus Eisenbacteria bacterium]
GTMAARAVVRDVGRALGIPYGEVDRLAKLIPKAGMSLQEALASIPELKQASESEGVYRKLIKCALTLEGLARHASTHAAGVLIAPGNLTDYVPLFRSGKDEIRTQYDMKSVEKIGLLKMDFLGLRTLAVLEKTLEMVNRGRSEKITLEELPLDDEATFELLRNAQTVGVFQLESAGMRDLLKRMKPTCFEDIIAVNALHRPGPLQGEMVKDYILCKHGQKRIVYQHPWLEPILEDTHGVILYQEQVLEIAHKLAGFSLGQADILRRAMGKKMAEEMDAQRKAFVEGARKNGIGRKTTERIFDLMANFAGYGFNKSHSAAYAMISCRTAYLKAHFPREFMAASLTSEMDDTSRVAVLVEECRRTGIKVLPPDVHESEAEFKVVQSGIRYGLGAVRNVGSGAISSVVGAREGGGVFRNLQDLCRRVDLRLVNKRVLESLVCAGACDGLPGHRAQLLSALASAYGSGQKKQKDKDSGQVSIFDARGAGDAGDGLPLVSPWPRSIQLAREKEMLGFYLSDHPLAPFRDRIGQTGSTEIAKVRELPEGSKVTVVGVISACKTIVGRNKKQMAFATLEDFSGSIECVVFADLFEKVRRDLCIDSILLVKARTSNKDEETKLIAQDIEEFKESLVSSYHEARLSDPNGGDVPRLEIRLATPCTDLARKVKGILESFPGESEVFLLVPDASCGRMVRVRARFGKVEAGDLLLGSLRDLLGSDGVRVVWPQMTGGAVG